MLEPNTRKCDGVTAYELGNDIVIFLEHTGELLRLNPTAAVVWKGLRSEMTSAEIVESLARTFAISAEDTKRDVERIVAGFEEAGLLREHAEYAAKQQPKPSAEPFAPAFVPDSSLLLYNESHCSLDSAFGVSDPCDADDDPSAKEIGRAHV